MIILDGISEAHFQYEFSVKWASVKMVAILLYRLSTLVYRIDIFVFFLIYSKNQYTQISLKRKTINQTFLSKL